MTTTMTTTLRRIALGGVVLMGLGTLGCHHIAHDIIHHRRHRVSHRRHHRVVHRHHRSHHVAGAAVAGAVIGGALVRAHNRHVGRHGHGYCDCCD